jgi:hypothetical protein
MDTNASVHEFLARKRLRVDPLMRQRRIWMRIDEISAHMARHAL